MKKIGEGVYYEVFRISDTRILKKEKSYWQKQMEWYRLWKEFGEPTKNLANFAKNLLLPWRYTLHLAKSKKAGVRAPEILANPKFTKRYDYEQDSVTVLGDYFEKHSLEDNKKQFEKYIELVYKTWERGFSDIVFEFAKNSGVESNGDAQLHDFNEITFTKNVVARCIRRKIWLRKAAYIQMPKGEFKEYVEKRLKEAFTLEKLDSHWKSVK